MAIGSVTAALHKVRVLQVDLQKLVDFCGALPVRDPVVVDCLDVVVVLPATSMMDAREAGLRAGPG